MNKINKVNEEKAKGLKRAKRREWIFVLCVLAWPILHKAVFYFGVSFSSFTLAFKEYVPETAQYIYLKGDVFSNFKNVFNEIASNPIYLNSWGRTIKLYAVQTFISMPISIFCSYFIIKKVPFSGFLTIAFFLPNIFASTAMSLMFGYFIEWALPSIVLNVSGEELPILLRTPGTAFNILLIYALWNSFAGGMVLYVGQMSNVGEGLQDACKIDGCGTMRELWHVVLPATYPLISVYLVTGFCAIFTGSGSVLLFYKYDAPDYVQTIGYILFTKVIGENSSLADYPFVSAMGLMISLIATPLTFALRYCLNRLGPRED